MDTIFKGMEGSIQYSNNIFIYDNNIEAEYQATVKIVLQQFGKHGIWVNLQKSEFLVHKTISWADVINIQEVKIESSKHKTMFQWPSPTNKKEI